MYQFASFDILCLYTVYAEYLAVALIWRFGESHIAKLNAHHLGCKHGFLSIRYSKPPIKNLTNCILEGITKIILDRLINNSMYTVMHMAGVLRK